MSQFLVVRGFSQSCLSYEAEGVTPQASTGYDFDFSMHFLVFLSWFPSGTNLGDVLACLVYSENVVYLLLSLTELIDSIRAEIMFW